MTPSRDDPRPLDGGARQILEAARRGERLSAERKAQLRARVMGAVGIGIAAAAVSAAEASAHAAEVAAHVTHAAETAGSAASAHAAAAVGASAKLVGLSLFAKIGIGVAIVTLGTGGWIWSRANEPRAGAGVVMTAASGQVRAASGAGEGAANEASVTAAPSAMEDPRAMVEAPAATGAASASPSTGIAAVSATAGSASPAASNAMPIAGGAAAGSPIAAADSMAQETRLITAAHAELSRGNAAGALALLDEHAARFPRGALAPERRAARAMALCKAGRADEGRREAEALYGKSGSPLAEKIDRACAK